MKRVEPGDTLSRMAMTQGTVTVNGDGTYTATGAAKAFMDSLVANSTYPNPASPPPGWSASAWTSVCTTSKVAINQDNAAKALAMSAGIPYIQQNADLNFAQNSLAAGVPAPAGGATVLHTQVTPGTPIT